MPDSRDAVADDQHVGVGENGVAGVHREHGSAAEHDRGRAGDPGVGGLGHRSPSSGPPRRRGWVAPARTRQWRRRRVDPP